MVAPSNQLQDDWRIELFSFAYKGKDWIAKLNGVATECNQLFGLLAQVLQWMKQPFAAGVRSKFKWLESLVHKLGKRVGRQLPNASNGDINRLLDLTSLIECSAVANMVEGKVT